MPPSPGSPWRKRLGRWALRVAIWLGVAALTFVVMAMLLENSFIYFPTRHPDGNWTLPKGPFRVQEVTFPTDDGETIAAWWAEAPGATHTLLWSHGNAGNLTYRADLLERLAQIPANVLLYDYRGYGKSTGRPTEKGLYRDVRAAYRWLRETRGIPPDRIVAYGKSLGGAVAVDLASEVELGGLILSSTFTRTADMAKEILPFVPVGPILRQKFDSLGKIGRVRCPILVLHSRADDLVPFELGRRLFEAAPEPKRFVEFAAADHNDTPYEEPGRYDGAIREFLEELPRHP